MLQRDSDPGEPLRALRTAGFGEGGLKTNAGRSKGNWLVVCLATSLMAVAQSAPLGSTPPGLYGQTLDDQAVVLPQAVSGKIALLVISTSRKAGERSGPWRQHFAADFASDAHFAYYIVAFLESAPTFIRGMIRSGIRRATPDADQSHMLTSAKDEGTWKKYLAAGEDTVPCVLLLDPGSHVRWSYCGAFDPDSYGKLKAATLALAARHSY